MSACSGEYVRDGVEASGGFSFVSFEDDLERDHQ